MTEFNFKNATAQAEAFDVYWTQFKGLIAQRTEYKSYSIIELKKAKRRDAVFSKAVEMYLYLEKHVGPMVERVNNDGA